MARLRATVVGATGMAGQQFVQAFVHPQGRGKGAVLLAESMLARGLLHK